ncbi:actin nucleation-promoting factor WASL isoform X2 [Lates calcarifer]|nr:actin nucleation-promoting factor WASL isoform X2 [Lates calcarifer]
MSSDHTQLLRRPLPPRRTPPIVKPPPAPRPSAGPVILDQSDAGTRRPSRWDADTPAPRAAPPTPLQPDTSAPLMDRVTEGFPCKPPRSRPRNPLLELLQSDVRFRAPPPIFCLSDFLQSHSGSQHNSQSPPAACPPDLH